MIKVAIRNSITYHLVKPPVMHRQGHGVVEPIRETCTLDDVPLLNLRKSEIELQMRAVLIGMDERVAPAMLATASAIMIFLAFDV
jgi:hypothetical protein